MIKNNNREMVKGTFLAPNYYKQFKCKGGECRDSCCKEWKVNISMNQYFLLHGLNCKKSVKEKIDKTFKPVLNPTVDRYAEIVHNQDGDCPLHKTDGYCLLHEACGEEVLPWVCRYYPRGPRIDYAYEVSCANSCEKTLELLFSSNEEIMFESLNLSFLINKNFKEKTKDEKFKYSHIRNTIFETLSDRNFSLAERIINLGIHIKDLEEGEKLQTSKRDFFLLTNDKNINQIFEVLNQIIDGFVDRYPRLTNELLESKKIFTSNDLEKVYLNNLEAINFKFPDLEIYFEKMLINDLFFKQFPFQANKSFWNQYLALAGTYVLLRYTVIGLVEKENNLNDLVDILSRAYTVISHSDFDNLISSLMISLKVREIDSLKKIIKI